MKYVTEFRGGTLYIRIDELDIQVTDFESGIGYITWATLELIIDHARQNNPEVSLRQSTEVKGEGKYKDAGIEFSFKVNNLLDYRAVNDEGFYIQLDSI